MKLTKVPNIFLFNKFHNLLRSNPVLSKENNLSSDFSFFLVVN